MEEFNSKQSVVKTAQPDNETTQAEIHSAQPSDDETTDINTQDISDYLTNPKGWEKKKTEIIGDVDTEITSQHVLQFLKDQTNQDIPDLLNNPEGYKKENKIRVACPEIDTEPEQSETDTNTAQVTVTTQSGRSGTETAKAATETSQAETMVISSQDISVFLKNPEGKKKENNGVACPELDMEQSETNSNLAQSR